MENHAEEPPGLILRKLSDIPASEIEWIWRGRIPLAKPTQIGGDPGVGKSLLTLEIAARVTTGRPWPDGEHAPEVGRVIMMSAEDDAADTLRPRLEAAGADIDRVLILEMVRERGGQERTFNLAKDLPKLEAHLERLGDVRLLVIDPISSYQPGVDSHRNTDVRSLIMGPLAALAARWRVAVGAVTHLSKGDGSPLNRMAGSIAYGAAARAAWLVARDPDPDRQERRLLLPLKNNLGPEAKGLAFTIVEDEAGRPVIAWEPDPVAVSAAEVMRERREQEGERAERLQAAGELLREILANGPVATAEVKAEAARRGICERTVERARQVLGVKSGKPKGAFRARWSMWLPEAPEVRQEEAKSANT